MECKFSNKIQQKMINLYLSGLSLTKIAKRYKCNPNTVNSYLKKRNIKRRSYSEANHKQKRYIEPQGYVIITPSSKDKWLNNKSAHTMLEHRLVMAKYLKRPLNKYEVVHHINGNRQDNRIENLELWSKAQPSGQRVKDKIKWAKEFLKQYGYKVYGQN